MIFPDGRDYSGRFVAGTIEGIGEMKISKSASTSTPLMTSVFFTEVPLDDAEEVDVFKGKWRNGKLNGLASIW